MTEYSEPDNRIEEALYGRVGTTDCHKVGIMGGCGLNCFVYREGRCEVPEEMGLEHSDDIDFHNSLYKNDQRSALNLRESAIERTTNAHGRLHSSTNSRG